VGQENGIRWQFSAMKIETVCPSKTLVNSTRLHDMTSQKIELFIVTVVITSDPTQ
jgi:N-acetylmuramic acid 6-phosphate (MurNAc-6-P) etherase